MRSCPRVLVVGPGPRSRGGVWSALSQLLSSPLAARYELRQVVTHRDGGAPAKLDQAARGIGRVVIELSRGVDLVWLHSSAGASFRRKAIVAALCRARGIPYVFHSHTSGMPDYYDNAHPAERAVVRRVLRGAERVICLGKAWEEALHRITPCETRRIMNPVSIPPTPTGDPNGPVVCAGRLGPHKGSVVLTRAFARAAASRPERQLVLAGDGDPEPSREAAATEGVADRLSTTGWVSADEVGALLDSASIFALPSRNEGLPMALLEAMARGLPSIVTPVGGIPDLVRDGEHGLFVMPDDVEGLSNKITELWDDPATATRMGLAARQRVTETCSPEVVAGQIDACFREIFAERDTRTRKRRRFLGGHPPRDDASTVAVTPDATHTITQVAGTAVLPRLQQAGWDDLVSARSTADPLRTVAWMSVWAADRDGIVPRAVMVHRDDQLVAAAALEEVHERGVKILRPLGHSEAWFDIEPPAADQAARDVLYAALSRQPADVLVLDGLTPSVVDTHFARGDVLERTAWRLDFSNPPRSLRKRRKEARRSVRRAADAGTVLRTDVFDDWAAIQPRIAGLIEFHQATFHRDEPNLLSGTADLRRRNRDAIRAIGPAGGVRLVEIRDDATEDLLAWELSFVSGTNAVGYAGCLDRSRKLESLGWVAMIAMLEQLEQDGVKTLDFGTGFEGYKDMVSRPVPLVRITVPLSMRGRVQLNIGRLLRKANQLLRRTRADVR